MTDNSSETTNDQQKMQSGKQAKPIKKLAVILVILFVLSGAVYLSTEFLFHAGGLRRISFITATDYFYSELLTLPLPFREGYIAGNTATFFKSNQSLSELNDRICQISDTNELATELFDDNNLLIKKVIKSGSNNQALFLIQKNNIKRGYYLFNLAADFTDYASPNKGYEPSTLLTLKTIFTAGLLCAGLRCHQSEYASIPQSSALSCIQHFRR